MNYPDYTGDEPCRSMPGELYFPENGSPKKTVIALCNTCDVLEQCRMYALHHESHGLWGGLTEQDRRALRKKMNIILQPVVTISFWDDPHAA